MRIGRKLSKYPFDKLDMLVEITLNPENKPSMELELENNEKLIEQFTTEIHYLYRNYKRHTFWLFEEAKISAFTKRYIAAIKFLEEQLQQNLSLMEEKNGLFDLTEKLLQLLETLERQIEIRSGIFRSAYGLPAFSSKEPKQPLFKVLLKLSVDQIAIILKAADESKLLIARSLSLVFRSIVPYLQTDKIRNISWKSARSSTYKFEERDKAVVIDMLRKLIGRIEKF